MGPELYIFPCVRCHLLGPCKKTDRLQWEQSSLCDAFQSIGCYSLLCRMIANAIELCFSAQFVKRGVIILVGFDVQIVCCEGESATMCQDCFKDVGVAAPQWDPVQREECHPLQGAQAI